MQAASRPNDAISAANRMSVKGLTLARGGRVLFEGLSLTADSGDFVEVRGPNGAGKTSLLRVLAGFLAPDGGAVSSDASVHFVGHREGLKRALTAGAHVRFWAALLGETACDEIDVLGRVGLRADWPVSILSQGQARRLALARLLAAPRPIWLLDEPATGLDRAGKQLLADMVGQQCASGGVVIAALHETLGIEPQHVIQLGAA